MAEATETKTDKPEVKNLDEEFIFFDEVVSESPEIITQSKEINSVGTLTGYATNPNTVEVPGVVKIEFELNLGIRHQHTSTGDADFREDIGRPHYVIYANIPKKGIYASLGRHKLEEGKQFYSKEEYLIFENWMKTDPEAETTKQFVDRVKLINRPPVPLTANSQRFGEIKYKITK